MNLAVIWDWDGTLADTADISKFYINEVRRRWGQNVFNDAEYEIHARGPFDYWDCYGDKKQEALSLFHDLYRDGVSNVILFDAVEELVKWIHKSGIMQYIISNKREDTLLAEVSKSKIGSYFKNIIGVQEGTCIEKPHPDMLERALKGHTFEKMVMVGDSAFDIKFGHNIGALSAFVESPFRPGCGNEKPDYYFKNHTQMAQQLKKIIKAVA